MVSGWNGHNWSFSKKSANFSYILTIFSKYVEAVLIEDKSAISVAKAIYKVYCRHGAPVSIICDQGKEFTNQVFFIIADC